MIANNQYTSVHIKPFLFKQVHEKHLKSGRPPVIFLGSSKQLPIYGSRTTNSFPSEGDSLGLWRIQKTSTQIQLFELKLLESAVGKNGPLSFWNSVSKAPTSNLLKICGRCSKAFQCSKTGLKWTQMNLSWNELVKYPVRIVPETCWWLPKGSETWRHLTGY